MIIQFKITEKDIVDFNVFHLLNNPAILKREKLRRFVVPGWLAMLYVFFLMKHYPAAKFAPLFLSPFLIIAAAWFLSYQKIYRYNVTRRVRSIISKNPGNGLVGAYSIKTGKNDMTITTEAGKIKYAFSEIVIIKQTDAFLYLYRDENTAIAVPKSVFKSKTEENTFIGYFKKSK